MIKLIVYTILLNLALSIVVTGLQAVILPETLNSQELNFLIGITLGLAVYFLYTKPAYDGINKERR